MDEYEVKKTVEETKRIETKRNEKERKEMKWKETKWKEKQRIMTQHYCYNNLTNINRNVVLN